MPDRGREPGVTAPSASPALGPGHSRSGWQYPRAAEPCLPEWLQWGEHGLAGTWQDGVSCAGCLRHPNPLSPPGKGLPLPLLCFIWPLPTRGCNPGRSAVPAAQAPSRSTSPLAARWPHGLSRQALKDAYAINGHIYNCLSLSVGWKIARCVVCLHYTNISRVIWISAFKKCVAMRKSSFLLRSVDFCGICPREYGEQHPGGKSPHGAELCPLLLWTLVLRRERK